MFSFSTGGSTVLPWIFSLAALGLVSSERNASAEDLLPDVTVDVTVLLRDLQVFTLPGATRLAFSTSTPNLGPGYLEIVGGATIDPTSGETAVIQRVYRSDGSFWDRPAGTFVLDSEHGHVHVDRWAVYRLRARTNDGGPGDVVFESSKRTFCLFDVSADVSSPFFRDSRYSTCGYSIQGITPGWADVYDLTVPGQSVDITGILSGFYWFEVEVDPDNKVLESDETNNVGRVLVFLGPPPPATLDAYEPNDTPEEVEARPEGGTKSPNLGPLSERTTIEGLSMTDDDRDYFRIRLTRPAAGGFVRIESAYLLNDLDLAIEDANGTFVRASLGSTAIEQVPLDGLDAGEYSIRITGNVQLSGANADYRLIIDPETNVFPGIGVAAPSKAIWVERALENPAVRWTVSPAERDGTTVSLAFYRSREVTKDGLTLPAYQHLDGAAGATNVNSEGFGLGEWFVHAEVADARGMSGAWAAGSWVIYTKGDINFDGAIDRLDLALVRRALRTGKFEPGWNSVLDMDRDGRLTASDWRTWRQRIDMSCRP